MGEIRNLRISAHQVQLPVEEGFTGCRMKNDMLSHDHGGSC